MARVNCLLPRFYGGRFLNFECDDANAMNSLLGHKCGK